MEAVAAVSVPLRLAQLYRKHLEVRGFLHPQYRLQQQTGGTISIPILPDCVCQLDLQSLSCPPNPVASKKASVRRWSGERLDDAVKELLQDSGVVWSEELRRDLPRSWQRHGDLALLGENCFTLPLWRDVGPALWKAVSRELGVKRLARMGRVSSDGFRSPMVTLLLGEDGCVTHVDNGIRYQFDVTKCMFSAGNITEKLRVGSFDCRGETVVDLYAGIGYFTLPYLVHAKAAHVHACEWNPHAVEALRRNVQLNGVSERCTIHPGDNRQLQLCCVADRVNLGLIPSSEEGWPVACRLLKRQSGGILHVHHNVDSQAQLGQGEAWSLWAKNTAEHIASLLKEQHGGMWRTRILNLVCVKSYAPHVHHLVLDLECRPS